MNITVSNCNYLLTAFYKRQEQVGQIIDNCIVTGNQDLVPIFEKEYKMLSGKIDQLVAFRKTNDCLLEGDPGYGPV